MDSTKRKAALVLGIIKGETSIQEVARQHGLTVAEIEDWKERFFLGECPASSAEDEPEALRKEQIKKLKQKIGDLVMDIDILKEAAKRPPL